MNRPLFKKGTYVVVDPEGTSSGVFFFLYWYQVQVYKRVNTAIEKTQRALYQRCSSTAANLLDACTTAYLVLYVGKRQKKKHKYEY